ncbi:hypothetical protein AB8A21_05440 [Streptomyces sp. BF23-18]|uniref:hypothetical protein n=1 Tax=Streptomyces sp. BF23-18 TaxID=3240282 RepID=UPI0034E3EF1A
MITADALHTRHDHASYLCERGAHYLAVVKENHPALHERVRGLPLARQGWRIGIGPLTGFRCSLPVPGAARMNTR